MLNVQFLFHPEPLKETFTHSSSTNHVQPYATHSVEFPFSGATCEDTRLAKTIFLHESRFARKAIFEFSLNRSHSNTLNLMLSVFLSSFLSVNGKAKLERKYAKSMLYRHDLSWFYRLHI